jgi:hypothetical protein
MLVRGKGNEGSILLEAMIALFLLMSGFSIIFCSLKTSLDFIVKSDDFINESVLERNEKVSTFHVVLSYEK